MHFNYAQPQKTTQRKTALTKSAIRFYCMMGTYIICAEYSYDNIIRDIGSEGN